MGIDRIKRIQVDYNPFEKGFLERCIPLITEQSEVFLSSIRGEEASAAYNLTSLISFSSMPDMELLNQAFRELVRRHDSLRASVYKEDMLLCVSKNCHQGSLQVLDISAEEDIEKALQQQIKKQAQTAFDLAEGPLFIATFIKTGKNSGALCMTGHHIIVDGWSIEIIAHELSTIYSELQKNGAVKSLKDAFQYARFCEEKFKERQTEEFQKNLEFWLKKYEKPLKPLEWPLPPGKRHPAIRSYGGARVEKSLSSDLLEKLKQLSQSNKITLFTVCYSAYLVLLHRITNQKDFVVGLPNAGQPTMNAPDLVGHCVATLPLRHQIDSGDTFLELLQKTKIELFEMHEYKGPTFGDFLEHLELERDESRIPLIPSYFNYITRKELGDFGDIAVSFKEPPRFFETFELYMQVAIEGGDITLECHYNTDLFDGETIQSWLDLYSTLFDSIVHDPGQKLGELNLLPDSQLAQMEQWNETAMAYPDCGLNDVFEKQVSETPEATALCFEGSTLSYAELNERANCLAHYLLDKGIQPNQLIGVFVERSLNMVVSVLGILKAGAAYLPLDPEYPRERISYILEDAKAPVAITQKSLKRNMPSHEGHTILIDSDWTEIEGFSKDSPQLECKTDNLAYTIYTSGSTGNPKGVQVTQRNVVNFLESMAKEPGLTRKDKLLAVTTLSFDIHVLELYLPLIRGAEVHIASRALGLDGEGIGKYIKDNDITYMQATPATWRLLLQADWQGEKKLKALVGGEALPRDLVPGLLKAVGELWNMYGPTETTVWSTCCRVVDEDSPIFVGGPIGNTFLYVLDSLGQRCPIGIPGELYIGGDGVTKGYVNREDLNAAAFVPDPFINNGSSLMYKTGDLVKLTSDGQIEYINRLDNQVKIRGYRIELGEVESRITEFPAVRETVAVVRTVQDTPVLVAYSVLDDRSVKAEDVHKFCMQKLPVYMAPQFHVFLDELPKTPNQKIDRKALPEPSFKSSSTQKEKSGEPRDDLEISMLKAWQNVLCRNDFGIHDRFMDIGGHSLQVIKLVKEMLSLTNLSFSYEDIFREQTIAALSDSISREKKVSSFCLVPFNDSQSDKAIYYIAGINIYIHLSKSLGDGYRHCGVFVNEEIELVDEVKPIESFVDRYVEAISSSATKECTLYLVGLSFGGIIAVEVAKKLKKRGYKISLVIMLDTYLPGCDSYTVRQVMIDAINVPKLMKMGQRLIDRIIKKVKVASGIEDVPDNKEAEEHQFRRRGFIKAFLNYQGKLDNLSENLFLIKSNKFKIGFGRQLMESLGWENTHPKSFKMKEISAGHIEMLEAKYTEELADLLLPAMKAYE